MLTYKTSRYTLLFIILTELISLLGYYYQIINSLAFFAIAFLTLILSLRRLEYGLYILLAELFIGSFGYLFYFENGGVKISLRIALWLIIMSVWLARTILSGFKARRLEIVIFQSRYFNYFFALFIFVAWGVVNGLLNNNSLSNIFFDLNNWLYFLLIFPVFSVLRTENSLNAVKQIFLASASWLGVKTLILAYIFSHNFTFFALDLYRWVRTSGAGEITQVVPGFSRIFMQSHIFVLIGFFFFVIASVSHLSLRATEGSEAISRTPTSHKRFSAFNFPLSALFLSAIIVSFSRSFWVGLAAGALTAWLITIFKLKITLKQFITYNLTVLSSVMLSLILIIAVIKFPLPRAYGGFSAPDLLQQRATALANEAGAASRWQLLPVLWQKIKTAPVLGRGFGATVTYKSSDPRVLAASPGGLYTTFAFEWGWLDVWLKLGLFGLLAYLALFIKLIKDGLKINSSLSLSLAVGLIILAAVNIFSPYVNHPLGIGYIILVAAFMEMISLPKYKISCIL